MLCPPLAYILVCRGVINTQRDLMHYANRFKSMPAPEEVPSGSGHSGAASSSGAPSKAPLKDSDRKFEDERDKTPNTLAFVLQVVSDTFDRKVMLAATYVRKPHVEYMMNEIRKLSTKWESE